MKHKRSNKSVVPQGRIWWRAMGRHPLNAMIGQVVQRLRQEKHWSLRELACEAGLTKSYLCGLEHGEHSPTFEVMLRLAGCNNWLWDGCASVRRRAEREAMRPL